MEKIIKITKKRFNSPISVDPGDTLIVTYYRDNKKLIYLRATIREKQICDYSVFVEYTEEEARALKMESAFGLFAGQMQ